MRPTLFPIPVLLAAGIAAPAAAQVTPEDVWSIYRDFYSATGLQITATEARAGETLTLSDITANVILPEGLGAISMVLSPVDLTQAGDGTVTVAYAQPTTVRLAGLIGPAGEFGFDITLSGTQEAAITASGTPDAVTVSSEVTSSTFGLTDLVLTGEPEVEALSTEGISFDMEVGPSVAVTTLTRGEGTITMGTQSLTGPTTYSVAADLLQDLAFLSETTGATQSTTVIGSLTLPETGMEYLDMGAMLRAGFALDVASRAEGISSVSLSSDPTSGQTRQESETAFSETVVRIDSEGLLMEGSAGPASVLYEMADLLPVPVTVALEGAALKLALPLLAAEAPQTAQFALSLDGLSVDDRLLRLFDPSELLPREPVSLEIDVSSDMVVTTDLVDVMAMSELMESGAPPAMPQNVTLSAGNASAVGAALVSSGAFDLDFTDMESFDGFPAPVGSARAEATGVNGLLDTLVQMGLLSDQDVMGARMGLGMFTRVIGDDVVEVTLEVTPEGHVMVNGNRMR